MFDNIMSADPARRAPNPTTTTVAGVLRMTSVGPSQPSAMVRAEVRVTLTDALQPAANAVVVQQKDQSLSSTGGEFGDVPAKRGFEPIRGSEARMLFSTRNWNMHCSHCARSVATP